MIHIRHYTYKPEGSTTYKVKFFKDKKYWFQENTVHTDYDNADRLGRHRVTELELSDHARRLGVVEISTKPLAEIALDFVKSGRRKGGRRGNPWSEKHAKNVEVSLAWWLDVTGWAVLEDINLAEAEEALDEKRDPRTDAPASGKTKNNTMSHLSGLVTFATKLIGGKDRLAPKDWDPLEDWEEYNDDPTRTYRDFELGEFRLLLEHSESQEERAAYLAVAATGIRFSAAQAVKIFDADFIASRFRMVRKTNKSRKEVWKDVPRWIMAELELQARGRGPSDPLLLGLVGHHGGKTVQRRLRAGGVPIETAKGVLTFHSLKVTFVNLLWDMGTDSRTVQAMAEHSSVHLSTITYARNRDSLKRDAAEGAGDWLKSAMPPTSNDGVTLKARIAGESMQAVSSLVGAVGFEPTETPDTGTDANIGKSGHPQASLIPFKKAKSAKAKSGPQAPLGIPGPGSEPHTSNSVTLQLAQMWDLLPPEAHQSVLNHARGWLLGLLPNKHRVTA